MKIKEKKSRRRRVTAASTSRCVTLSIRQVLAGCLLFPAGRREFDVVFMFADRFAQFVLALRTLLLSQKTRISFVLFPLSHLPGKPY